MADQLTDDVNAYFAPQVQSDNNSPEWCSGAYMDYQVELVARAFYDAEYEDCLWDGEAEFIKQEYREYARNAINLLHDDIGVLLLALERATADEHPERSRAAA
jgi:hypothetical protein